MAKQDKYEQFMRMDVTQTGTNVLTFARVGIGMSVFEYAAMVVSRIEYRVGRAHLAMLINNTQAATIAVCGTDNMAVLDAGTPDVYDFMTLNISVHGTPASAQVHNMPYIHDFTGMHGGGLLIPANDVFLGLATVGYSAATSASVRLYYTIMALQAADYIELVQRLRILTT